PFDIPNTYYRAIGEIIARQALFDFHVMLAIGELLKLKDPKKVRVSFMGMATKARLGALRSMAANWAPTPQIRTELHGIIKDALKLTGIRNNVAHGYWGYFQDRRKLEVIFA